MKIDWILIGWIIDMILNGIVWLIIAALALPLIDKTDKWTRKAVKLMGSADDFVRKVLEDLFELIEKKNLQILAAFILMIIFGVLARTPKIIINIKAARICKFFFSINSKRSSKTFLTKSSALPINLTAFLVHLSVLSISGRARAAIMSHTIPFKIMSIIQPINIQSIFIVS